MGEVGNTAVEDPKINGDVNGTHEETEAMEVDSEAMPDPSELKKSLNKEQENSKDSDKNGSEEVEDSEKEPENGNGTDVLDKEPSNGNKEQDAGINEPSVVNDDSQEAMEVDGKIQDEDLDEDEDNEEDGEDSPEIISNDESSTMEKADKPESSMKPMKIQEVSEAVVLSDTDDEDEDSDSSSSKMKSGEQSSAISDSENGISNAASSTNPSRMDEFEDDKPVSIHSDSEEEEPTASKQENGAKSNESSDKDDCIVIDDEKDEDEEGEKKEGENNDEDSSPRRSLRPRKPVQKDQDFDDDIEEIIEDPLDCTATSAPKRMKIGNTTIDLTSKKVEATVKGKEPSLVIIDTDTIMQKRQSAGFPVNLSVHSTNSSSSTSSSSTQALNLSAKGSGSVLNPFATQSTTNLLPNLTDDMFVLEAPSFIVPYIYEKPPASDLKEVITKMGAEIEVERKKEKERRMREEGVDSDEDDKSDSLLELARSRPPSPPKEEKKDKKKSKRRRNQNGDESWDEYDTSTDEEASDSEQRTKVLIKEADIDDIKTHIISADTLAQDKKSDSYFDSPLGKFFMTIGVNLVQEYVQSDLLRQQRRKREREGKEPSQATQIAIASLQKNLEMSKENNAPFKYKLKRCEYCPFKTESALVLAHHYETPHLRGNIYKCNYCEYETRPAHEILYHMEAIHNVKGKLEKPLSYHQCPNCPFEDNGKSKLARHEVACAKKYKPEINLNPPLDWEPPAKIPKIKAKHGLVGAATAYQAMAAQQQQRLAQAAAVAQNVNKLNLNNAAAIAAANAMRNRGRPQTVTKASPAGTVMRGNQFKTQLNSGMMLSNNYQLAAATLAAANSSFLQQAQKLALLNNTSTTAYLGNMGSNKSKAGGSTPSISITPLPRTQPQAGIKPGQNPNSSSKAQFVICEICDGYIKDLDQLRNHMQWIHKVKIHPKMIYNRPPLNCQKCQFRFFTDQGLERHLLGSHGLVTSSMQEAANKGKDSGRCPVCGKVYQWKLLNHVSRDHNMTLKPAHLSYKCTVCTATFGMYKQFESHVYSAHSTVAKKDNKNKAGGSSSAAGSSSSSSNSLLKPLKINEEITIIPQPSKSRNTGRLNDIESHVID